MNLVQHYCLKCLKQSDFPQTKQSDFPQTKLELLLLCIRVLVVVSFFKTAHLCLTL